MIVRDLDPPREPGCFPIFQVMFGMERFDSTDPRGLAATLLNMAGPAIEYREFTVELVAVARNRAPFDMTFTIEEFNNQIFGVVDYRRDLWENGQIAQLIEHYQAILHQIVASSVAQDLATFALGQGGCASRSAGASSSIGRMSWLRCSASPPPDRTPSR